MGEPYTVGNLQIEFSTLNKIDFQNISKGLNLVKNAIIRITNIDSTKLDRFSNILSDLSTKFLPFLSEIREASDGLSLFNYLLKQFGTQNVSAAVAEFQKYKNEVRSSEEQTEELNSTFKDAEETLEDITPEIRNTNNALTENERQTKKTTSGWKKFLNQIKRITIYRLIRAALKAVVNTFKDTINAFAEVDDGVNNTVSNITSSFSIIKLGIGSTILPLLQMIEPIVNQIAISFANLGNMISASLSTDGKFTKINTKAWKDYREQIEKTNGALLDFDKFRVLNQQRGNLSDFLLPNQSVEEYFNENGINETAERIKNIVYDVSTVLSDLFNLIGKVGVPAIKTILTFAEPVINFIARAIDGLTRFIDKLDELGILEPIIEIVTIGLLSWGGVKVIGAINKLITNLGKLQAGFLVLGIAIAGAFAVWNSWADMSTWQRAIGIIGVAITALTGLAIALGMVHSAVSAGLATAGIVAGIAMIVGAVSSAKSEIGKSVSIPQYAQGGIPDIGTMFIAGEAGAEMVYNMPSGQSGVANVSQIEQAFYNALVRYGRENRGSDGAININIDGQAVFKAVDREAGKRGLGFARK